MSGTYTDKTLSRCPNCGKIYSADELTCTHCGMPFVTRIKKNRKDSLETTATRNQTARTNKPITLYCGGKRLSIPVTNSVIVGRNSVIPDDLQPDIDLSDFDAFNKGVSRQHVKIVRQEGKVYVSDMGSSNSTLLNGIPLIPNTLKELRNGDELRLGSLNLKIAL